MPVWGSPPNTTEARRTPRNLGNRKRTPLDAPTVASHHRTLRQASMLQVFRDAPNGVVDKIVS
jgi:hypothetical protein